MLKITIGDEDTIVWAVSFLSNGMIATGDSKGLLQFWNSKHGTLISVGVKNMLIIFLSLISNLVTTRKMKSVYKHLYLCLVHIL